MARPSNGPGHFTFVLGWGFVGRWQGANEKLMSPHLANCQAQDARIRAFVWISTVQGRAGLGDSQLWIEKLDYPRLHLPLLKKGLFQDNSILSLGSMVILILIHLSRFSLWDKLVSISKFRSCPTSSPHLDRRTMKKKVKFCIYIPLIHHE